MGCLLDNKSIPITVNITTHRLIGYKFFVFFAIRKYTVGGMIASSKYMINIIMTSYCPGQQRFALSYVASAKSPNAAASKPAAIAARVIAAAWPPGMAAAIAAEAQAAVAEFNAALPFAFIVSTSD
jgi:hypothetical protein